VTLAIAVFAIGANVSYTQDSFGASATPATSNKQSGALMALRMKFISNKNINIS
jgi:hypothetical protein